MGLTVLRYGLRPTWVAQNASVGRQTGSLSTRLALTTRERREKPFPTRQDL